MIRFARLAVVAASIGAASASHAEDAPAAPVAPATPFAVVFLESDLTPPIASLPADQRAMLTDWKIDDIGRLVKERAPVVLQANGFAGDAVIAPRRDSGEPAEAAAIVDARPLVVLRLNNIVQTHPRFFVTAGAAYIDVAFYPVAASGAARTATCHGRSGSTLGFDPVWGITKTNRVDAAWTDRVVAGALDLLARQGCLTLPGPRPVLPKG